MKLSAQSIFKNAPQIFLGAFFLCASCKGEPTADKPAPPDEVEAQVEEPASGPSAESTSHEGPVRFMAYNIKNYLTMDVYVKGGKKEPRPKRPEEVAALVDIIVKEKPDILGICEIGTEEDLAELQGLLKKAGLDLPYSHYAGGMDEVRHLAVLSALPIAATNSQDHLPFKIGDEEFLVRRGILDVTINLPGGPTHFIGLHLKSKRPSTSFDEAEVRLNEARLARAHCNAILKKNPEARIVLYGDMNDTRKTPPLSMMMGNRNSDNYLEDAFLKDSRGHIWTYYWSYQQQYSRFDYALLSRSLKAEVDWEKSYIVDPDTWLDASDHRPLMLTFGE
ncbi:MAG: endonuclease/exonuclease/phosphatase family protein [Akkermansiaceae bacterium]